MKITCPTCSTSYALGADALGPEGRTVQCARCLGKWHAQPDEDRETAVSADAESVSPAMVNGTDFEVAAYDIPVDEPDATENSAVDESALETESEHHGEMFNPDPAAEVEIAEQDLLEMAAEVAETSDDEATDSTLQVLEARANGPIPAERRSRQRSKRARKRASRPAGHRSGALKKVAALGAVTGALILAAAVPLREPIVRHVPNLSGIYQLIGFDINLKGLAFRNVTTTRELNSGVVELLVQGEITNVTDTVVDVPAVKLALRVGDKRTLYAWSANPETEVLAAGQLTTFKTRLTAPPENADNVRLEFGDQRKQMVSAIQ